MKQAPWLNTIQPQTDHRWGVILAGGNGARLQHFIKSRFGENRPKQYCALIGKRSMLRHTIDRVTPLFTSDHLFTTVSAQHLTWALKDLSDRPKGTMIIQPFNRETGPGILLPLLHIHHADPQAIVSMFPADHFILQEERYRTFVVAANEYVSRHPDHVVALGIAPSSQQYGYGWIEKGDRTNSEGISHVRRFWEKPDTQLMQYLYEKKCLWNTMTLVGTSMNLLHLYERHMNEVFVSSQQIVQSIGTTLESEVTERVFSTIPSVNFSHRILEHIPEKMFVLQMNGIYWNDWGDEERILNDIDFLEHQDQTLTGEKDFVTQKITQKISP